MSSRTFQWRVSRALTREILVRQMLTETPDWAKEEEVGAQANNTHLWEESWDDDDTTDDFSTQLK